MLKQLPVPHHAAIQPQQNIRVFAPKPLAHTNGILSTHPGLIKAQNSPFSVLQKWKVLIVLQHFQNPSKILRLE